MNFGMWTPGKLELLSNGTNSVFRTLLIVPYWFLQLGSCKFAQVTKEK